MLNCGETTEFKNINVKRKDAKIKTLAKVHGRTEELLDYKVDEVSVLGLQGQCCSSEVMEISNFKGNNLSISIWATLNFCILA